MDMDKHQYQLVLSYADVVKQSRITRIMPQANAKNNLQIELINGDICLQYMPEDCLREIFSSKSFTWMDMCSLAETCTRFRDIAGSVIPKSLELYPKYKTDECEVVFRKGGSEKHTHNEVKRIFKNFGSIMSKVVTCSTRIRRYWNRHRNYVVLNLIADHCTYALEHLDIQHGELPTVFEVKLKPIFERLRYLNLEGVKVTGDKTLFAEMNSLVELRVDDCRNDAILQNSFPKLERFRHGNRYSLYHSCANQVHSAEIFADFISRHKTLQELCLFVHIAGSGDKIIHAIGNSCSELEELYLQLKRPATDAAAAHLQPLHTLKSLRSLTLKGGSFEDFEFILRLPELRELCLCQCELLNVDPNQFLALAHLIKLSIIWCSASFKLDVVGIISRLEKLEILEISRFTFDFDHVSYVPVIYLRKIYFRLDEVTFSKIIDIVKKRQNVLTLSCDYDETNLKFNNFDENQRVKLIHLSKIQIN